MEIDVENGKIRNLTKNEEYEVKPLPPFLLKIIKAGGLIEYLKEGKNEV